jgi:hypothetical protein
VRTLSLKIDVCTREGLLRGVPPLLGILGRRGIRASFFLAFGPDNSGKALRNVFRPGFLLKMIRTGAPRTYGLRTVLSGTLLPARVVAAEAPDLVRRIAAEGHEVAIHGWDHRLWQDGLPSMDAAAAGAEVARARDACAVALGAPPEGTGAPGWIVTAASLEAQDGLDFRYASDLRAGPPCRLSSGGRVFRTPQFPSTGPCIEEILATGVRGEDVLSDALLGAVSREEHAVIPVHAEFEGRAFAGMFERLLPRLAEDRDAVVPLRELAASQPAESLPLRELDVVSLPGRPGGVAASRPAGGSLS